MLRLWQVHQIVTSSKAQKSEYRVHRDFIALFNTSQFVSGSKVVEMKVGIVKSAITKTIK